MNQALKAIETTYKGYRFRSRLEARWAVFFDTLGMTWRYEAQGYRLHDGTYYLPDFEVAIPGLCGSTETLFVEVKPGGEHWDHPGHESWMMLPQEGGIDGRFIVLSGTPWPGEYEGFVYADCGYKWCECHLCGAIGIEFQARCSRILCGCTHEVCGHGDRCFNGNSQRLLRAYGAARAARFEHGEHGAPRATKGTLTYANICAATIAAATIARMQAKCR